MSKKVALVILDGWGIGDRSKSDAIASANTPFFNSLLKNYPHSCLKTSGEDVGLPHGQMGNSEVGHLNIGAGRVVYQDLVKINVEIRDHKLDKNPVWNSTLQYCVINNKPLHLMGLVSDGGVHSHQDHLHALISLATTAGVKKIFVHCFTDGRIPKVQFHISTSLMISVRDRTHPSQPW
jgi:2,3-bisphosphoglycerate-independent phosphoglycerate mutase